jgi:hypothetical protein
MEGQLEAPTARTARIGRPMSRVRSLCLVAAAALLELLLIAPFVDHLADANPTIHFTQHGLIFLGGVMMGIALRDAYRQSHS